MFYNISEQIQPGEDSSQEQRTAGQLAPLKTWTTASGRGSPDYSSQEHKDSEKDKTKKEKRRIKKGD